MRILHTSDWHLGRTLHGVDLLEHQAAYLDHVVDLARDQGVAAVLVAGDVYDRAVPPVAAVELLADALARLAAVTHVVLTPGNHDSATRLGFGAPLFTERVRVRCRVAEVDRPVVLTQDGGAYVYPLPYLDPETARWDLARPGSGEEDDAAGAVPARSHEAVVGAAMARVRADLAARRAAERTRVPAVVMAHAFVVGGMASDSERDIRVGGVDVVPTGVFGDAGAGPAGAIDYVALGHLHGAQEIGRGAGGPILRYAGSPLAYSFSEKDHRKSSAVVTLGPEGVQHVDLVPAPVPRRLVDVQGTLRELLGRGFDAAAQAWARVTVTDAVRPPDLLAAVSVRFPHALQVVHRPADEPVRGASPEVGASTDPLAIAAQFVRDIGGRPATDAELAVLRQSYEAALAAGRSA